MIEALLMVHFTVGFFLALLTVMFFWPKEIREFVVDNHLAEEDIIPILNHRFYLFLFILIAGFHSLLCSG